jgi:hypothetical protein
VAHVQNEGYDNCRINMASNLDRFTKDLNALVTLGEQLEIVMERNQNAKEWDAARKKALKSEEEKKRLDELIRRLPSFTSGYQRWYSESIALLRQLLPDRLADFVRHYEKPKGRKELTNESYRVEDYLQGLAVTRGTEVLVDRSAAVPHFRQQLAILKAAKGRFESSLFDIRQLVQADLLDSELEAAELLAKHRFTRAAGALAGVVLEGHLAQVLKDHAITLAKKNPTISDFNEALKADGTIDVPQWRFVQHLADIRNLCDHSRTPEPTAEQVADLLAGAKKVIKTIF